MKKTRVIILGGGISGLSLAYFLSKRPEIEVVLIEKEPRLGGWLESGREGGFFFEKGPRTFKTTRSSSLLDLAQELQIVGKIVVADKAAHARYLWHEGLLQKVPDHPLHMFTSSLTRPLIPCLFKEWRASCQEGDESIWEFVCRRFNKRAAEILFDPLVTGIYAGDSKDLSVEACFPRLKEWERKFGSLTKGLLFDKRKTKEKRVGASLFSFRDGIETLVQALKERSLVDFVLQEEVMGIDFCKEGIEVFSKKNRWKGDFVFCALPSFAASSLFEPWDKEIASLLKSIRYAPITTVNVGYKRDVLPIKAFGYLIPRKEKEEILGTIFDSKIFLEQNCEKEETRLTVMIGDCLSKEAGVEKALRALAKHLGITERPDYVFARTIEKAIPQFRVGHQKIVSSLEERRKERFSRCAFLGNYISGVSVNDCIAGAKKISENFA